MLVWPAWSATWLQRTACSGVVHLPWLHTTLQRHVLNAGPGMNVGEVLGRVQGHLEPFFGVLPVAVVVMAVMAVAAC